LEISKPKTLQNVTYTIFSRSETDTHTHTHTHTYTHTHTKPRTSQTSVWHHRNVPIMQLYLNHATIQPHFCVRYQLKHLRGVDTFVTALYIYGVYIFLCDLKFSWK